MEKKTFVSDLHLACSKDELRPVFQCVHFINGYAYATDGNILIKQSLEYSNLIENYDLLECKAIHADNFKEIRKYQEVEVTEDGFYCTAKNKRKAFFPFAEFEEEEKVPDFDQVFSTGITQIGEIGMMPRYVGMLEKALAGGGVVKATFAGVNRGILFHSTDMNYEYQVAMIMPCMLSND